MNDSPLPQWASRVKRETISRLYAQNAAGIYDEDLADDVAYALFARAESIRKVTRAHTDNILDCPSCSGTVGFAGQKTDLVACKCGWSITREKLLKTYQGKQLVGGKAIPIIEDAIKSFPARGTYTEKMFWIDSLIHAFHGEINDLREKTGLAYRPVACNFIGGSVDQVVELVFSLAYGDSPDFMKSRAEWINKLKITPFADRYFDR